MKVSGKHILYVLSISFILFFYTSSANTKTFIDSLEQVLSEAASVDDSLKIVCNLTWNISNSEPDKTKQYGDIALLLSTRTNDPRLISEALDAAALGNWVIKENRQAEKLYKRSLQTGSEHHLIDRVAWCNYNLAQIAMNNHRRDSALMYIHASQKAFIQAGMYNEYLRSHWLELKLLTGDEKRLKMQELTGILKNTLPKVEQHNDRLTMHLDIARLYGQLEDPDKSLEYMLKALGMAEESDSTSGILMLYSSIGEYLRDIQQNHTLALEYYKRTLETYRNNNIYWGVIDMYFEIGNVYKAIPDDSAAIRNFKEALKLADQIDASYYESRIYNALGEVYCREGNYKTALNFYRKSIDNTSGKYFVEYIHSVKVNLGDVYIHLKRPDSAYVYFLESIALADSSNDSHLRAVSYSRLANWYQMQNNIRQAEIFLLLAQENARKSRSLNLQTQIVEQLSNLYAIEHQYKKAFQYQQQFLQLNDSLQQKNQSHNLARLESLFELENLRMQKEVDRAVANAKIERHLLIRNFFIGGFLLMSLLGIYFFINYRKKKKANILLAEQKMQIEEMSEKVHEVDEMKLQFFTNISHELRTPLTLITGLTEQLSKSRFSEKQWKERLQTIYKNASKLHTLVNQILDIRKLDNGGNTLSLVEGDMVRYITGVVSVFKDYARRKNIELVFVSDKNQLVTRYDFDKLDKILSNILSNAIKFCDDYDKIRVTLYTKEHPHTHCILEVDDTGQGIPEDQLKFIFQPFYQASNTHGGSGLGLALVRELVRLLQGSIDVDSMLGKGTRITIQLPVEPINTNQHAIAGNRSDEAEQSETNGESLNEQVYTKHELDRKMNLNESDKKSLLIIEDNVDLLEFVSDIMQDDFSIITATNGNEGFDKAIQNIPDIIISDIMMPGIDGIQVCKKLKETECTSHIPILMLTAKTDQESMLKSFKSGADDYIVKPFSAVLLRSRIENLVDQRRKLIQKFTQQFHIEPTEIILPDADKKFLDKLIQVIEDNISETSLDIDFLASEMHVSRTQLYRKLKALTDLSGNQFIRAIRLKRAAQLLSQQQMNIAQVMQETGFSNYSHFNACFRELFNKSPREYAEAF